MVKPETCPDSKALFEICDLLLKRMKTLSIWKENIAQEFDFLQTFMRFEITWKLPRKIGLAVYLCTEHYPTILCFTFMRTCINCP